MAADHYDEFINEAFVQPIRSVLIIDDDYPTFDDILNSDEIEGRRGVSEAGKSWRENPARIRQVLNTFRTSNPPMLIDIHDGQNVGPGGEIAVAEHLHQSDLLVLDFELDKTRRGDGGRAIGIIRKLAMNPHFNLVVVHTSEDLHRVFDDILIGLLAPVYDTPEADGFKSARELIETAEDNHEGIEKRLLESISEAQYLFARKKPDRFKRSAMKGCEPFGAFKAQCDAASWDQNEKKSVLCYLLAHTESKLKAKMAETEAKDLQWTNGQTLWLRTDSLFLAFSAKADGEDLLISLQAGLKAWGPWPSRLFLSKFRAAVDEFGVVVQHEALRDKHALAYWYDRLLQAEKHEQRWHVSETIDRHAEQLTDSIAGHVEEFAHRLVTAEMDAADPRDVLERHFRISFEKVPERQTATLEHNAFVCSKPPKGWHLTTGHVFSLGEEFWVCLSPACDMVPSQHSGHNKSVLGKRLPFLGVKLQKKKPGKSLDDINSNRYVFLRLEGEDDPVSVFCLDAGSTNTPSSPEWEILYADKCGEFRDQENKAIRILRTEAGARKLVVKEYNEHVVGQLRYEYALNLIQKLGVSMTRIGLDFSAQG